MFVVITDSKNLYGCSILHKEVFDEFFPISFKLYESDSYTDCEAWIGNTLAEERNS